MTADIATLLAVSVQSPRESSRARKSWWSRIRLATVPAAPGEGRPLKLLVGEVGYASESALSRAFKAQVQLSPRDWMRQAVA